MNYTNNFILILWNTLIDLYEIDEFFSKITATDDEAKKNNW